jgi:excisionase family DNA binding protein
MEQLLLRLLLSKRDTAARLNISVRTLENLVAIGEIRPRRIGKRVLFELREISRFSRSDHRTKRHDDARN